MSDTNGRPLAVTFDLDGTLYDAGRVKRAYVVANLFRLRPVRVALRVREELRGSAFDDGNGYFAEEARRIAERLAMTVDETRALVDELLGPRLCSAIHRAGARKDARDAVRALVDGGVHVAVISDYRVEDKLAALGLTDLPWSALVAADRLGALKPHRRAFDHAAEAMRIPAARIVHVGDRLDTDVEAATAAGFGAVLLGSPAPGVRTAASLADAATMLLEGLHPRRLA